MVNQRHNTGLDHKGHYLTMAQVLAIENRVPSAHYRYHRNYFFIKIYKRISSDTPLISAQKVDYYPTTEEISTMKEWCVHFIAKTLVKYWPPAKSCKKHLQYVIYNNMIL